MPAQADYKKKGARLDERAVILGGVLRLGSCARCARGAGRSRRTSLGSSREPAVTSKSLSSIGEEKTMKLRCMITAGIATLLVLTSAALPLRAQTATPKPGDEALASWNEIGRKLITMAEDFPESKHELSPRRNRGPLRRSCSMLRAQITRTSTRSPERKWDRRIMIRHAASTERKRMS